MCRLQIGMIHKYTLVWITDSSYGFDGFYVMGALIQSISKRKHIVFVIKRDQLGNYT